MFCFTDCGHQPGHGGEAGCEGEEEGVAQRLAEPSRQGHGHDHEAGHKGHIEGVGGVAVALCGDVGDEGTAHGESEAEAELGEKGGAAEEEHAVGLRMVCHEQIGERREGQHDGCGPEEGWVAVLAGQGTAQRDADGEGQHTDGALGEADILHRAAESARFDGCEEEEDAGVEHEGWRQEKEEEAEQDGQHVGLLLNAREHMQFFPHGVGERVGAVRVVDAGSGQEDDVQHQKQEESACHEGTLHGPSLLITAKEDLEEAGYDDEQAVGDHQHHLRGEHLGVHEERLLMGREDSAVVEAGEEFVPCTKAGEEQQEQEEEPHFHLGFGDIDGNAHEAEEQERLHHMEVAPERAGPAHHVVEIRLHDPRQEEHGGIEGGHDLVGTELHEHDEGHIHDHCHRNLFGGAKARNPEPRAVLLLECHFFICSVGEISPLFCQFCTGIIEGENLLVGDALVAHHGCTNLAESHTMSPPSPVQKEAVAGLFHGEG